MDVTISKQNTKEGLALLIEGTRVHVLSWGENGETYSARMSQYPLQAEIERLLVDALAHSPNRIPPQVQEMIDRWYLDTTTGVPKEHKKFILVQAEEPWRYLLRSNSHD